MQERHQVGAENEFRDDQESPGLGCEIQERGSSRCDNCRGAELPGGELISSRSVAGDFG